MTRNPNLAAAIQNRHESTRVNPLLRKPDGTLAPVLPPEQRASESEPAEPPLTGSIQLAATVTEFPDWIWQDMERRPLVEVDVDPENPLLDRPTPEPVTEPVDHACDAPDCCSAADRGVDDMVQRVRRTVPPVPMPVAERDAAQEVVEVVEEPMREPGQYRRPVGRLRRMWRDYGPLRPKAERGVA